MSKVNELLRKFICLSKEDRDWMLTRLPDDVRGNLLLKLADFVDDELHSSATEPGANEQLITALRWSKILEAIKKDCRKNGKNLPSRLIAFIASEQAKHACSSDVMSSNNG
jgi:hypothetical protein